ncbi:MAG: PspC domain-containing protein [Bacteroidetes bacterium]|nr:PspC domain-containing protein [Bacteroidota bacterium]
MTQEKTLYRSFINRRIAGVAGGLAEHFSIDPVIVRIAFVMAALCGGGGLLIYIILWIVIPESSILTFATKSTETAETINTETTNNYATSNMENQFEPKKEKKNYHGNLTGGLILITLGILFLIARFVPNIDFGDLWPVILIIVGITILMRNVGNKKSNDDTIL